MDNKKVRDSLGKTSEQRKSRRGFIKKSSVVAGVSMLPASNVWGACNVSGVSGGSQAVNQTCTIAPFHGGHDVHTWSKMNKPNAHANRNNIRLITTGIGEHDTFDSGELKTEFYYKKVRDFLNGSTISLSGNHIIPGLHVNVGGVLSEGSSAPYKKKLVAAVFANITLGFLHVPAQFHGSQGLREFIEHIWGSLDQNYYHSVAVIESSFTGVDITEGQLASKLHY